MVDDCLPAHLLTFSLSGFHHLRDLHSFPTRRSSDRLEPPHVMPDGERAFAGLPHCLETAGPGDRKSTRLNSSHLGISYAVFCLKKKTLRESLQCTTRQMSADELTPKYTSLQARQRAT